MRVFICSLFVVLLVACGPEGCECAGGGTVARKSTAYQGDPMAKLPYIQTGQIHLRELGCDGNLCEMWAGLRPVVHNPLDRAIKVRIVCRYWLDGAELARANPTKHVTIVGPASRKFEGFDLLFSSARGFQLGLSARCAAEFDGYPDSYNDATN